MRIPNIWVKGGKPKHVKQLQTGSPTAAYDCGPCSVIVGLERASRNEWRPWQQAQGNWVGILRNQMTHSSAWPATTLDNHEQAVESRPVRKKFRDMDLRAPMLRVWMRGSHATIISNLKAGRAVTVAVDYGTVNRLMPHLSGSPTFREGHAITLVGYGKADGVVWAWLYDPLHDGRQPGIPKGAQPVRVLRYLRAAESFGRPPAGPSRAYYTIYSNPLRRN